VEPYDKNDKYESLIAVKKKGFMKLHQLLEEVDAFLKQRNAKLVGDLAFTSNHFDYVNAKVEISLQVSKIEA
jgi:hypothetical protein